MKTKYVAALSLLAGAALGVGTVEVLHAQAKPKAYVVAELETLDAAAAKAFAAKIQAAQIKAGAHPLRTGGNKVVAMTGTAPNRVAITEYNSLDEAIAFYKSKAWTDAAPERNKAIKTIRRYAVEAAQ